MGNAYPCRYCSRVLNSRSADASPAGNRDARHEMLLIDGWDRLEEDLFNIAWVRVDWKDVPLPSLG